VLLPIAQRHGVQLYLSGHDHNYERLIPVEGMTSIVTGGGGALPYGLREVSAFQSAFRVVYHFTQLRFEGDTLTVRCISQDGKVEDQSVIRRRPEAPRVVEAALGTPDVDLPPQTPSWEAHGMSRAPVIASVTGRSSNLGQLRVMMDGTYLHLSLEGLAFSQGSDVYLFLEVPGLPGVASLAGLGDGRGDLAGDPAAEGVDGLDLAEGVSFADGFRPSVGIVVSDVLAQQQDRRFRRPRSQVALGQGVFRLDAALSSVPDVRIRAWNPDSVRGVVTPGVSSADAVQISIPRRTGRVALWADLAHRSRGGVGDEHWHKGPEVRCGLHRYGGPHGRGRKPRVLWSIHPFAGGSGVEVEGRLGTRGSSADSVDGLGGAALPTGSCGGSSEAL
jgi:hypothetical protein